MMYDVTNAEVGCTRGCRSKSEHIKSTMSTEILARMPRLVPQKKIRRSVNDGQSLWNIYSPGGKLATVGGVYSKKTRTTALLGKN